MSNKSKIRFAIVPLIVLGIISFFYIKQSEKEKDYITEYLKLYYSQLKINTLEKEKIENSIISAATNGENNVKYDVNKIVFYNKFKKYLSSDYIQFMLRSGEIPNFELIEYGIKEHVKSFKIENLRYKKGLNHTNDISYDVLIKSADNRVKVLSFNQKVTIEKKNGKILITRIQDNFGN